MATSVIMPKAGMAMESGTVIRWFKKVGDQVTVGEPILEIQTDKVAMEVEAEVSGFLIQILHDAGDEVPVTQPIGYIGTQGEKPPAAAHAAPAPEAAAPAPASSDTLMATPAARRRAGELDITLESVTPTGTSSEIKLRDVEAAGSARPSANVSPLARKIAEQKGIDPALVEGTGPGGRIIRQDVERAMGNQRRAAPAAETTRTPLAGARKIIAQRMLQSHLAIPPVTLNARADVSALLRMRSQINAETEPKISINDLVLMATARALTDAPYMLQTIDGDSVVQFHSVNLGMAVALETGLLVPVIRDADELTLSALAHQSADLARRARERKLLPDDLAGGTFTVTNLGMYGVSSFTPIINPSEGAILGVNAAQPEVFLEEGQPKERMMMTLSLTIDHRVIDGAQGALFLQKLVSLLESPFRILL